MYINFFFIYFFLVSSTAVRNKKNTQQKNSLFIWARIQETVNIQLSSQSVGFLFYSLAAVEIFCVCEEKIIIIIGKKKYCCKKELTQLKEQTLIFFWDLNSKIHLNFKLFNKYLKISWPNFTSESKDTENKNRNKIKHKSVVKKDKFGSGERFFNSERKSQKGEW